ncbi:MAG: Stp1/IreP family PP2C-type Ser/Thr phosphatase [Clostridia bacterium]|nr:Stp1/IreP family PP2C-type Ser/Thr phosphatase [Clostridia bacterium]
MEIGAATSAGCVRPVNEDAYYVSDPNSSAMVLAIIADGMGGHNAGEIASGKAVAIVQEEVLAKGDKSAKEILVKAVDDANREIHEMSKKKKSLSGMGTTITACVAENKYVTVVQVGDSRLYQIRKNSITQITKDHSLVELLVENGEITKEEAKSHPQKNIITRAVGTEKTVESDVYEFKTKKDDVILLCSDGLVNMVEDETILSVVSTAKNLEEAANTLVSEAEAAGGTDNITVILIQF